MITRIVSRCGNCGYENRFPIDSDDSDAEARSDMERGDFKGEALTKMCEDVHGAEDCVNEIRELMSEGWILRDVAQVCMMCPECYRFGARIWYSAELRTDGKRTFRNNEPRCDCGAVMKRFDPIEDDNRKARFTCVKCGADNLPDREFKLKDFE